jgi:hypothetical protein
VLQVATPKGNEIDGQLLLPVKPFLPKRSEPAHQLAAQAQYVSAPFSPALAPSS